MNFSVQAAATAVQTAEQKHKKTKEAKNRYEQTLGLSFRFENEECVLNPVVTNFLSKKLMLI